MRRERRCEKKAFGTNDLTSDHVQKNPKLIQYSGSWWERTREWLGLDICFPLPLIRQLPGKDAQREFLISHLYALWKEQREGLDAIVASIVIKLACPFPFLAKRSRKEGLNPVLSLFKLYPWGQFDSWVFFLPSFWDIQLNGCV